MGKYIDRINLRENNTTALYLLSADYATSANTSTIASAYTFDRPLMFWDDFVEVTLDHPYKYSPTQVSSLNMSAVALNIGTRTLSEYDDQLKIFNTSHSAVDTIFANSYVYHSLRHDTAHNSHLVESIAGNITQTATESVNVQGKRWIIPVKFKVMSCVRSVQHWTDLYDGDNISCTDGNEYHMVNVRPDIALYFKLNDYLTYGTTVPAVLFRDADIAEIPIYNASNLNYRLNTQVFSQLGNVGHVDSTSGHEFVKFMKALQNLQDSEITSATVKANLYPTSARVYDKHYSSDPNMKSYSVLSANVTDKTSSCGVLFTNALNLLQYAFYDSYGNYMSMNIDDDTIFDDYTYYCTLSSSTYADSAAAIAAVQNTIDARSYERLGAIESVVREYMPMGTIPFSSYVFNCEDCVMGSAFYGAKYRSRRIEPAWVPCLPQTINWSHGGTVTVTSVKPTEFGTYRDLITFISKPIIDTIHVKEITDSTYTYTFDNLYTVNSAYKLHDTSGNYTLYKTAAFNMIHYSNPLVAPYEQCVTTFAGADTLVSNYYNYCDTVYRSTALPNDTSPITNNDSLLPIANGYSKEIDTQLETLPTRDIYFCLTLSK